MNNKIRVIYSILLMTVLGFGSPDYLILYHCSFTDQGGWQSNLEDILESNGHDVIFGSISNGYTNSYIRSVIENYKNTYSSLKYILLVGKGKDNPIPQGESFPEYNHTANSSYGNYIPFYYYIDNNYWKEQVRDIPSDRQYISGLDIYIGRIPVSSIGDIENWLSKLENYYQSLSEYSTWKNRIRHFSQNNDNVDNHCKRYQAELKVIKSKELYIDTTKYDFVVNYMRDVYISDHCTHSEDADELFRDKIEEGAGVTIISGTGSDKDNLAGFFFTPDISNYSFNNANPNFIIGNTCTIGNTSHTDCTNGTVLENLLINPDDGIVGAFAPTVGITTISSYVGDDIFSSLLMERNIRCVGELASEFYSAWDNINSVNYLGTRGSANRNTYDGSYVNYHVKSMVLYGDPSMPLALYKYISDDITQNTVWSGSIIIEDDITISSGVTVTIMPGTGVFIASGKQITVDGKIEANGTSSFPIRFQSVSGHYSKILLNGNNNEFTYCVFDGGYNNMYVKSRYNIFEYCTFKNATNATFYTYKNSSNQWCSFTLDHCLFDNNYGGIEANYCYGKMINTTITDAAGDGLSLYNAIIGCASSYYISVGGGVFTYNVITDNSRGIDLSYNGKLYLGYGSTQGHNKIVDNDGHEVYLGSYTSTRLYQSSTGGYSDIYDPSLGYYIYNLAKTYNGEQYVSWTVPAENDYWGTSSGPSGGDERFYGSVDWHPYKTSSQSSGAGCGGGMPQSIGQPELQLAQSILSEGIVAGIKGQGTESAGNGQGYVDIKQQMLDLRNQIATHPNDLKNCRRLVTLYSLMADFDPEDNLGERSNIISLVELKRHNYEQMKGAKILKKDVRLIGEVAMLLEIDWLLNQQEQYEEALALIEKYDPYIDNSDNRRELLFQKLSLYETINEYTEALNVLEELKKEVQGSEIPGYEAPTFEMAENRLRMAMGMEPVIPVLAKSGKSIESETMEVKVPEKFAVHSNYPNPFNPVTTVPFELPEASIVKIQVFDLSGRQVAELTNKSYQPGYHNVTFDGSGMPSGMYFVRALMIPAENRKDVRQFTQKMMLMK